MLELIPLDTQVYVTGSHVIEVMPDGVSIRLLNKRERVGFREIAEMAHQLTVLAAGLESKEIIAAPKEK